MSPDSTEMIRSAIRYSGKDGTAGTDVVVVEDVEVVGTIVVVVEVVEVDVVVVEIGAGSFDDVHDAATSTVAMSKYERALMIVDSIRLNPRCLAPSRRRIRRLPSMSFRSRSGSADAHPRIPPTTGMLRVPAPRVRELVARLECR